MIAYMMTVILFFIIILTVMLCSKQATSLVLIWSNLVAVWRWPCLEMYGRDLGLVALLMLSIVLLF